MSKIVESLSIEEAFRILNKEESEVIHEGGKSPKLKHIFFKFLRIKGGKISDGRSPEITHRIFIDLYEETAARIFGVLDLCTDIDKYVDKQMLNQLYNETTNPSKAYDNLRAVMDIYEHKTGNDRMIVAVYTDGEDGPELFAGDDNIRKSIIKILEENSDKWASGCNAEIYGLKNITFKPSIYLDYTIQDNAAIENLTNLPLFEAAEPYLVNIGVNNDYRYDTKY